MGSFNQVRKRFAFSPIQLHYFGEGWVWGKFREEYQPIGLRNSTPINWTSPASWVRLTLA
jgi:hypothetical protein